MGTLPILCYTIIYLERIVCKIKTAYTAISKTEVNLFMYNDIVTTRWCRQGYIIYLVCLHFVIVIQADYLATSKDK